MYFANIYCLTLVVDVNAFSSPWSMGDLRHKFLCAVEDSGLDGVKDLERNLESHKGFVSFI